MAPMYEEVPSRTRLVCAVRSRQPPSDAAVNRLVTVTLAGLRPDG
jgi:hypothetical protein